MQRPRLRIPLPLALLGVAAAVGSAAADLRELQRGGTIYLPIYSQVYFGDRDASHPVRVTVVVRNTDPKRSVTVSSAEYYDSTGKLVRETLPEPVEIGPLGTERIDIGQTDVAGGYGPSMLVRWKAERRINPPLVEAVMISLQSRQGISFSTRGVPVRESGAE